MRLTAAERKTLALMTNLACEWESTLADSYTPGPEFADQKLGREQHREVVKAERNIVKFKALRDKILRSLVASEDQR